MLNLLLTFICVGISSRSVKVCTKWFLLHIHSRVKLCTSSLLFVITKYLIFTNQ